MVKNIVLTKIIRFLRLSGAVTNNSKLMSNYVFYNYYVNTNHWWWLPPTLIPVRKGVIQGEGQEEKNGRMHGIRVYNKGRGDRKLVLFFHDRNEASFRRMNGAGKGKSCIEWWEVIFLYCYPAWKQVQSS